MIQDHQREQRAHRCQRPQLFWPRCSDSRGRDCRRATFRRVVRIADDFRGDGVESRRCVSDLSVLAAADEGIIRLHDGCAPHIDPVALQPAGAANRPEARPQALVAAVDIRWLREPIRTTVAAICGWLPSALEHDREKCVAAFRRDHAQIKKRRGHHGGKRGRTASPLRARSRRSGEGSTRLRLQSRRAAHARRKPNRRFRLRSDWGSGRRRRC